MFYFRAKRPHWSISGGMIGNSGRRGKKPVITIIENEDGDDDFQVDWTFDQSDSKEAVVERENKDEEDNSGYNRVYITSSDDEGEQSEDKELFKDAISVNDALVSQRLFKLSSEMKKKLSKQYKVERLLSKKFEPYTEDKLSPNDEKWLLSTYADYPQYKDLSKEENCKKLVDIILVFRVGFSLDAKYNYEIIDHKITSIEDISNIVSFIDYYFKLIYLINFFNDNDYQPTYTDKKFLMYFKTNEYLNVPTYGDDFDKGDLRLDDGTLNLIYNKLNLNTIGLNDLFCYLLLTYLKKKKYSKDKIIDFFDNQIKKFKKVIGQIDLLDKGTIGVSNQKWLNKYYKNFVEKFVNKEITDIQLNYDMTDIYRHLQNKDEAFYKDLEPTIELFFNDDDYECIYFHYINIAYYQKYIDIYNPKKKEKIEEDDYSSLEKLLGILEIPGGKTVRKTKTKPEKVLSVAEQKALDERNAQLAIEREEAKEKAIKKEAEKKAKQKKEEEERNAKLQKAKANTEATLKLQTERKEIYERLKKQIADQKGKLDKEIEENEARMREINNPIEKEKAQKDFDDAKPKVEENEVLNTTKPKDIQYFTSPQLQTRIASKNKDPISLGLEIVLRNALNLKALYFEDAGKKKEFNFLYPPTNSDADNTYIICPDYKIGFNIQNYIYDLESKKYYIECKNYKDYDFTTEKYLPLFMKKIIGSYYYVPYWKKLASGEYQLEKIMKRNSKGTLDLVPNSTNKFLYFMYACKDGAYLVNISKFLNQIKIFDKCLNGDGTVDSVKFIDEIYTTGLYIKYTITKTIKDNAGNTKTIYTHFDSVKVSNIKGIVYKIFIRSLAGIGLKNNLGNGLKHLSGLFFKPTKGQMKGGQLVDTSNVGFGDTSTEKFKASSDFNEQLQKHLNDEPIPQLRGSSKADRDRYREEMASYNKRKSEKQKDFMGQYKSDILKANDQKFLEAGYTKDKNGKWQKPASLEDVPWLNDVAGAIGARNFLNKAISTGETFYNNPNLENTIALGKTAVDAFNTGKTLAEKVVDPKKLIKDIAIQQGKKALGMGLNSDLSDEDYKNIHLYKNGRHLISGQNITQLKKLIKENILNPKNHHTVSIVKYGKGIKKPLKINEKTYTITPDLSLNSNKNVKNFSFSESEIKSLGFSKKDISNLLKK